VEDGDDDEEVHNGEGYYIRAAKTRRVNQQRDNITQAMWDDYVARLLRQRG
jgi:hypothetical protein